MGCICSKPAVEDPARNASPASSTPQGTAQGTQAVAASSQVGGEPSTSGGDSSNVVEAGATPTMEGFIQNQLDTAGVAGGAGSDGNTLQPAAEQTETKTMRNPEPSETDLAIARSLGDIGRDALKVLKDAFPTVKTTLGALAEVLTSVGETLTWIGPAFKFLNIVWERWQAYKGLQQQIGASVVELLVVCDTLRSLFEAVRLEGGHIMARTQLSLQEQDAQQFFWARHFQYLRQATEDLTSFLRNECGNALTEALAAQHLTPELQTLTATMKERLMVAMLAMNTRQNNAVWQRVILEHAFLREHVPESASVRFSNVRGPLTGLRHMVGRDEVRLSHIHASASDDRTATAQQADVHNG
eukprot:scaffold299_cov343-Prasinococcus_capsulatus_cf.AAC.2